MKILEPRSDSQCFLFAVILHVIALIFLITQLTFPTRSSSANMGGSIIQASAVSEEALQQYNEAVPQNQKQIQTHEVQQKQALEKAEKKALIEKQKSLKEQQIQKMAIEKAEKEKKEQAIKQHALEQKKNLQKELSQEVKNDVKKNVKADKEENKKKLQQQLKNDLQKELTQEKPSNKSGDVLDSHAASGQSNAEIDKYKALVVRAISQQWMIPENLAPNLTCELGVRVAPGGVVLSVTVVKSSGNPLLDNSAVVAVKKASPLPVPSDPSMFDAFRDLHLAVKPDGSMVEE